MKKAAQQNAVQNEVKLGLSSLSLGAQAPLELAHVKNKKKEKVS